MATLTYPVILQENLKNIYLTLKRFKTINNTFYRRLGSTGWFRPSTTRRFFWNQSLSMIFRTFATFFLSSHVAQSFQWVPGHAGLPGSELAALFAKTEAILPYPCSSPLTRSFQRLGILTILLGDEIFLTTFSSARFLRLHPSLSCRL